MTLLAQLLLSKLSVHAKLHRHLDRLPGHPIEEYHRLKAELKGISFIGKR